MNDDYVLLCGAASDLGAVRFSEWKRVLHEAVPEPAAALRHAWTAWLRDVEASMGLSESERMMLLAAFVSGWKAQENAGRFDV